MVLCANTILQVPSPIPPSCRTASFCSSRRQTSPARSKSPGAQPERWESRSWSNRVVERLSAMRARRHASARFRQLFPRDGKQAAGSGLELEAVLALAQDGQGFFQVSQQHFRLSAVAAFLLDPPYAGRLPGAPFLAFQNVARERLKRVVVGRGTHVLNLATSPPVVRDNGRKAVQAFTPC